MPGLDPWCAHVAEGSIDAIRPSSATALATLAKSVQLAPSDMALPRHHGDAGHAFSPPVTRSRFEVRKAVMGANVTLLVDPFPLLLVDLGRSKRSEACMLDFDATDREVSAKQCVIS